MSEELQELTLYVSRLENRIGQLENRIRKFPALVVVGILVVYLLLPLLPNVVPYTNLRVKGLDVVNNHGEVVVEAFGDPMYGQGFLSVNDENGHQMITADVDREGPSLIMHSLKQAEIFKLASTATQQSTLELRDASGHMSSLLPGGARAK